MKAKYKNNKKKQQKRKFTPWHIVFENILAQLLPLDKFKIEARVSLGKMPLQADIIIVNNCIKDINDQKTNYNLPYFFDFFNDFKYIVIEYKSPKVYFSFFDYMTANIYASMYINQNEIKKIDDVCIVGVFNKFSEDFESLMEQNGFKIIKENMGLYKVNSKFFCGYLVNLDELELHHQDLVISLLSNNFDEYGHELKILLEEDESLCIFINNLNLILKRIRSSEMYIINEDKELLERMTWTLEQTIQDLPIDIRLSGLKPEEIRAYLDKIENQ